MAAPSHADIPVHIPEVVAGAGEGITAVIDNYDSFTFNLVQYLQECGASIKVFRNDKVTIPELLALNPVRLVISPGPGTPDEAGVSKEAILAFAGKIPILGVCLGCQSMYEVYGGKVEFAGEIKHGKQSVMTHDGRGLFAAVPQGMRAIRYHSLAGTLGTFPSDSLVITARTDRGIIQGVRHKKYVMEGVQFHPESVATEHGHRIVANFLRMKGGEWGPSGPAGTGFPAKSTTSSSSSSSAAAAAGSAATNTAPSLRVRLDHADLVAMAKASGLKEGPEAARELAEAHAVAAAAATVAATGGASVPMES